MMNEGKNSFGNFWSLLVFYYFFAVLMVECSFFLCSKLLKRGESINEG